MQDTAGEAKTNSEVTFFNGFLHIDVSVLVDQQEFKLQQLCADTGCCLEDLPGVLDDRDRWKKSVREIRASSVV